MLGEIGIFQRLGRSARSFSPITTTSSTRRCVVTSDLHNGGHRHSSSDSLPHRREEDADGVTERTRVLGVDRDKIVTVPNLLCLSRIAISPYIAHLIVNTGNYPWALAVFGYAGVTDWLDGWIARNVPGQRSALGSFLDPLSDKVLMTTAYLSLAYVDIIPVWLAALVVSRDVLLVYAGLHVRYMSVDRPVTWAKFWNFSLPTAQVQPTLISKVNTSVQLMLVGVALCSLVFEFSHHPAYQVLCGLTGATTFASAVSYAFSKDVYSFKNRPHDDQFGKRLAVFVAYILFNVAFVLLMPRTEPKPPPMKFLQDSEKEDG